MVRNSKYTFLALEIGGPNASIHMMLSTEGLPPFLILLYQRSLVKLPDRKVIIL